MYIVSATRAGADDARSERARGAPRGPDAAPRRRKAEGARGAPASGGGWGEGVLGRSSGVHMVSGRFSAPGAVLVVYRV